MTTNEGGWFYRLVARDDGLWLHFPNAAILIAETHGPMVNAVIRDAHARLKAQELEAGPSWEGRGRRAGRLVDHDSYPWNDPSLRSQTAAWERGWKKHRELTCPKVPHTGAGYLHGEDDDRPYDVDGVVYCGRCHEFLAEGPEGR